MDAKQSFLFWTLIFLYGRVYLALECSSSCPSRSLFRDGRQSLIILRDSRNSSACKVTCSSSSIEEVGNLSLASLGKPNDVVFFHRDSDSIFSLNLSLNADTFLNNGVEPVWFAVRDENNYFATVKAIILQQLFQGAFNISCATFDDASWRIRSLLVSEILFKTTPILISGELTVWIEILEYPACKAVFSVVDQNDSHPVEGKLQQVLFTTQGLLLLKDGYLFLSSVENPLILRKQNLGGALAHLRHDVFQSRGLTIDTITALRTDGTVIMDATRRNESLPGRLLPDKAEVFADILRQNIVVLDRNSTERGKPTARVSVYRKDGSFSCPPFTFPQGNTRVDNLWLQQRSGLLYAFGNEVWHSKDGGCLFEVQLQGSTNGSLQVLGNQIVGDIVVWNSSGSGFFWDQGTYLWYQLEREKASECYQAEILYVDDFGIPHLECCINTSNCKEYQLRKYGLDASESMKVLSVAIEKPREMKLLFRYETALDMLYFTNACSKVFRLGETSCRLANLTLNLTYKMFAPRRNLETAIIGSRKKILDCINTKVLIGDHVYAFLLDAITGSSCQEGAWSNPETTNSPDVDHFIFNASSAVNVKPFQLVWARSFFGYILNSQGDEYLRVGKLIGGFPKQLRSSVLISSLSLPQILFQHQETCSPQNKVLDSHHELLEVDALEEIKISIMPKELVCEISSYSCNLATNSLRVELVQPLPGNFRVVRAQPSLDSIELVLTIKDTRWMDAIASVIISPKYSCSNCHTTRQMFTAIGTCPKSKRLVARSNIQFEENVLMFGRTVDDSGIERVYNLPVNYRPPSWQGKAIPTTDNVYNADPAVELYQSYGESRTPSFKQCYGKRSRSECACNKWMTVSNQVKYSDCIFQAYRLLYHEIFRPRLFISRRNHKDTDFLSPLQLEEINGRRDFSIYTPQTSQPDIVNLFASNNSSILLIGSGLYHFRFKVTPSVVSFCDLTAEIIVFVDDSPLAYPTQDLVRISTAFIFGAVLFVLFLLKLFKAKREAEPL